MRGARGRRPGRPTWETGVAVDNSLNKLITNSRSTGALNLASKQLKEVPPTVYNVEADGENVKWWEVNELTKLDLSYNEIQHLPEQLWAGVTALNTLHLSSNKLRQLPQGISALSALKLLDVSDNPLSSLPEEIASLPALASLSCSNCSIPALPDALGVQQPNLTAVNASGNHLTAVPTGLRAASSLAVLNLGRNQLTDISAVAGLQSLKELDVSYNKLQALPESVGNLPRLSVLDAKNNQISGLPAALGTATALLELKLGFNRITELSGSMGMLVNLKTLDLRNNLLQALPDTLCGLQLVLLDLTNNSLSRLPPALGHMTSLRSLPLDGNPLKLIRREIWSGPVSTLLQHLRDQVSDGGSSTASGSSRRTSRNSSMAGSEAATSAAAAAVAAAIAAETTGGRGTSGGGELSLSGKGLSNIPAEVWQSAASLGKLDLSNNPLAQDALLPQHLATLSQLKVLCLNSCNLVSWPLQGVEAGSLEALHTLECKSNPFRGHIPAGGLAACPALRSLDLSGVRGLHLSPSLFSSTPQLEVLIASNAALPEFPTAALACLGLRQLRLNGNNISSLPLEVTALTRLGPVQLAAAAALVQPSGASSY
eukprot:GHUV01027903.1.p1 GENE.GHUV01027903.1~~GHUV01027903.1.p1  ORF type:complete len:599 (+),score=189.93 GHUV01027903.1:562-2358(+)